MQQQAFNLFPVNNGELGWKSKNELPERSRAIRKHATGCILRRYSFFSLKRPYLLCFAHLRIGPDLPIIGVR